MKKCLITGITGQDGAYLTELLLSKNYEVHGIKRRASSFNTQRIDHIYQDLHNLKIPFILHYGDLTDFSSLIRIIQQVQPDEIYNLGAMSHVAVSFENPEYAANVDALGTLRILEATRVLGLEKKVKIYQASTSELYGKVQEIPQTEKTPFYPRSPYGVAKLYGFWITKNYREAYNIYAVNGILFNHESPLRGETFVTRKITRAVAHIVLGEQEKLYLGNLNAQRDWGHAKDYVEAIWLTLQQPKADDYVLATGITTSVRDFVKMSFEKLNITLAFEGKDENEKGIIVSCSNPEYQLPKGKIVVEVDEKYYRPTEVECLVGDATKAREVLKWKPKHDINSLIDDMITSDINNVKRNQLLKKHGYKINAY